MSEAPPRTQQPTWILLPLRAFLAIVFLDGGISKIADRRFLDGSSPTSMHASVLAVKSASPIGGLLGPVVDHSFAFGLFMAAAEVAVGVGILLGLWTRVAAAGGMVLALSLWFTISWNASPWFTSADVVYLFAFTPLLIAGAGALSLDAWLDTAAVQHPGAGEDRTRRSLITAGAAVAAVVVLGGATLGRRSKSEDTASADDSGAPSTSAAPATASPSATGSPSAVATGPELIKASEVPVGGGKQITDPSSGDPTWVLQLESGDFTALDAVCPHQGCPVSFVSAKSGFQCPCHGSTFSASGDRKSGPATKGLTKVPVTLQNGVVRRT